LRCRHWTEFHAVIFSVLRIRKNRRDLNLDNMNGWECDATQLSTKNSLKMQSKCDLALSSRRKESWRPLVCLHSKTVLQTSDRQPMAYHHVSSLSNGIDLFKSDLMNDIVTTLALFLLDIILNMSKNFNRTFTLKWRTLGRLNEKYFVTLFAPRIFKQWYVLYSNLIFGWIISNIFS
jgi:hypothetical protein